nr:isochorismatase family cysteine hydrolase [Ramlibacter albus]
MLLVDFINPLDFPGAEKLAPGAVRAARATLKLREKLDREKVAVVYANDNYGVWQSDFHSLVSRCIDMDGPPGEIARLLAPRATDITLLKPRHSAFFATPLELLLDQMGAREIVLAGVAADMCVQMSAADAFLRDYKVWVPADCIAAETAPAKAAAVKYMKDVLRCDVRPSTAATRSRSARGTTP